MVEVMVAFIVLLIVLAVFANSILATGEAEKYAKEIRTEADTGMRELQEKLNNSESTSALETGKISPTKTEANTPSVKPVQYKTNSDGLIYWVFE